jgi:amino acid permease
MQVDNSSEGHLLEDFDNNESKLKGRNATTFGATINLMNTVPNLFIKLINKIVGGGILALPFAFRQTGLILGIFLIISVCLLSVIILFICKFIQV